MQAMTIACDPAIGHIQHGHRTREATQGPERPRPPDPARNRQYGRCAAKHDAVIQTHPHLVEQAFIRDAEQSSRAWHLQWNEREPATSERTPKAAQHVAAEPALIVVVNGRHHSPTPRVMAPSRTRPQRDGHHAPSPSALSTLSPAFMNLMMAAGVQRRTWAYNVVVVSKNP